MMGDANDTSPEYESMAAMSQSDASQTYETPMNEQKLDRILSIVSDIREKMHYSEKDFSEPNKHSHRSSQVSENGSLAAVQNSASSTSNRPLPLPPSRELLPPPSSTIQNRHSLPPRLPPSLPPRPVTAVQQSPPLPARKLSRSQSVKYDDTVFAEDQSRKVIGWLKEVREFINDNFDEDYVGKDENVGRIDRIITLFSKRS